mmetsp:Transcript_39853/g.105413  ORF Transcript_39853/g.105413 Transcript_39853/m.105413 type:complete len:252 (+) Transcript_39853:76-831(+)
MSLRSPISARTSTVGSEKTRTRALPMAIFVMARSLMRRCCSAGSRSARSSGMSSSSSPESSSSVSEVSWGATAAPVLGTLAAASAPSFKYLFGFFMLFFRLTASPSNSLSSRSRTKVMKHATNSSKEMKPLSSVSAVSNMCLCASFGRLSFTSLKIMRNSSKSIWLSPLTSYNAKNGASTLHIFRTSSSASLLTRASVSSLWTPSHLLSRNCERTPRRVSLPVRRASTSARWIASTTSPSLPWTSDHIFQR